MTMTPNNSPAAFKAFAITPGASQFTQPPSKGLLVCAAGNVTLEVGGVSITLTSVPVGTVIPLVAQKVTAATATVVGLY